MSARSKMIMSMVPPNSNGLQEETNIEKASGENDQIVSNPISDDNMPYSNITTSRQIVNYRTSPIHSNESDVDCSDADPSYDSNADGSNKKPCRLIIAPRERSTSMLRSSSSSSSSSTSSSSSSTSSSCSSCASPSGIHAQDTNTNEPGCSNMTEKVVTELINTLSENTPIESIKRGRKRTRRPENWKQNIAKRLRNTGKAYVTKNNKTANARKIKPSCPDQCRLKCSEQINHVQRSTLFDMFWNLGSINRQRSFISSCMTNITPKYKYTNALHPRKSNKAFHFIVNDTSIRVCKLFFINTLDISDRVVRTVKDKTDENGFMNTDYRGKHQNHTTTDEALVTDIKEFIDSIPRIESHYIRQTSSREFIDGSKTITDIFKDFQESQKQKDKLAGTYCMFYKIFTTGYNISFFKPRKDQCDLCMQYHNSTTEQKLQILQAYEIHQEEKQLSRQEKRNDRLKIDETNVVSVFDLQAVLQSPKGNTSSFYYKSKMNSYNFTIAQLTKKIEIKENESYNHVHSFFWNETDAKRGAVEIGSCLFKYFQIISSGPRSLPETNLNLTLYSDNCCGQNKNKYIVALYMYAVSHLDIETITHKFLIKGHTQNEGDNVHSLIEKEIQKNLKSGPIYSPHQYVALIKNAKKSGKKFHVNELSYDAFLELKKLQKDWGYNFNRDKNGDTVIWNDIKVVKVVKEKPFSFFYKKSYKDGDFTEVCVRNRRTKMLPLHEIKIAKAYTKKQDLSENKRKDLKELLDKRLIPSFYADFYNSVV